MKNPIGMLRLLTVLIVFSLKVLCPQSLDAIELLSSRDQNVPLPAGGNSDSAMAQLSPDGRFVVFLSFASDLVTNDDGLMTFDVFLRDRLGDSVQLVSVSSAGVGGGNGNSLVAHVSANGRYVVFQSEASNLIASDTNNASDIFVRDTQLKTNILASISIAGGVGDGASSDPMMTPDGRYVVFVSSATNLVANDTNGIPDLFRRDLIDGTTVQISAGAAGTNAVTGSQSITPDGRYVAFFSTARNLAPGVPAASRGEVYLRDLVADTLTWVSSNASVVVSNILRLNNMPSGHPVISDDGRFIAYKCGWTNGTVNPGGTSVRASVLFRFDAQTKNTSIICTNGTPPWAEQDDVFGPEMTPDGRFVAYVATNATMLNTTVERWDAFAGTNATVSVNTNGIAANGSLSDTPQMSADGRFVVFLSNAAGLSPNVVSNGVHFYWRDMQSAITRLVDADTNGIGKGDTTDAFAALSGDGRYVAFASMDESLVNLDGNGVQDVFVADMMGPSLELVSARSPGCVPQSGSSMSALAGFSLSDDGRWIAFSSLARDLVAGDENGGMDVFVRRLGTGSNVLASVGADGKPGAGLSTEPMLSRNGRFVVFSSTVTNLVANQTNSFRNIYRRDVLLGETLLVSASSNGSPGNGNSTEPRISDDGRYVTFLSSANNLVPGVNVGAAFLRDMQTGTTIAPAGSYMPPYAPALSADGRYVAYLASSSQLRVRDNQLGLNIYTNPATITSMVLSPSGKRLLYTTATTIVGVNLQTRSNFFSLSSRGFIRGASVWSADDRYVVIVTPASLAGGDLNGTNDVYLCDLEGSTFTLVSYDYTNSGGAGRNSDWPVLSGDGRFVVYRSFATNIVNAALGSVPNLYCYDRLTGMNRLLTPGGEEDWSPWHAKPAVSGDGSVVVFQSWGSLGIQGDLNRVSDAFGISIAPWDVLDVDADLLPDLWMSHYFGHATGQELDQSRPEDDADGDGMTNLQEFLAGTSPLDGDSVLRTEMSPAVMGNSVVLRWNAIPGKSYRVNYKNNLADADWMPVTGIISISGTEASLAVVADQVARFYSVQIE